MRFQAALPGLFALWLLSACDREASVEPDSAGFSPAAVGNTWVYQTQSFSRLRRDLPEGGRGADLEERRIGRKSILLKKADRHGDSVVFEFEVKDSLRITRMNSWGHRDLDSTHVAVFVKVGEDVVASSDFALAEFPLWANRKNCRDDVRETTWDGKAVQVKDCNGTIAATGLAGVGKIYDDARYTPSPLDSAGYRNVLVTFNGRPVPTGKLTTISGIGFDDQDYQGRPVDSTAFRQPEIGNRWTYEVSSGSDADGVETSWIGLAFLTLQSKRASGDGMVFSFSERDSGSDVVLGEAGVKDTLYVSDYGRDSRGNYFHAGGPELPAFPFLAGVAGIEFPVIVRKRLDADSVFLSGWIDTVDSGPDQGSVYMQSAGQLYGESCHCGAGQSHAWSHVRLRSFNGKTVAADSIGKAVLAELQR
jgi:hypothetical protein